MNNSYYSDDLVMLLRRYNDSKGIYKDELVERKIQECHDRMNRMFNIIESFKNSN